MYIFNVFDEKGNKLNVLLFLFWPAATLTAEANCSTPGFCWTDTSGVSKDRFRARLRSVTASATASISMEKHKSNSINLKFTTHFGENDQIKMKVAKKG